MPYPLLPFCKHGHERTPENTKIVYRECGGRIVSSRQCRKCNYRNKRNWEKNNPELVKGYDRAGNLRQKYGLTTEEWDHLLETQLGCCACCGSTTPGGAKNQWHVDHDHATGKVRSLLCFKCNVALGTVDDSVDHVEKLLAYIRRFSA